MSDITPPVEESTAGGQVSGQNGRVEAWPDEQPMPAEGRRWALPSRAPLTLAVGGVVTLALLVLAFQAAMADRIMPGVSILGVPVGGQTRAEAAGRLDTRARELLNRPIVLQGAGREWRTTPGELGLRLAGAQLAEAAYAVGRRGSVFERLGEQLVSVLVGRKADPDEEFDRGALDAFLQRLADEIDRPARDARLTLDASGRVVFQPGQTGLALQAAESRDRLSAALASDSSRVELDVRETPPRVPTERLEAARARLERILAEPLVLRAAGASWTIDRPALVQWLKLDQPADGPASVELDEAAIARYLERRAREIDQEPQNARFLWNGGKLKVLRESKEGRKLDVGAAVQAIVQALDRPGHEVDLPVIVAPPEVSSDNPDALGIVELIDTGKTSFAGSIPEKKHNIRLAAERLNGVVVPPGGTFSFNKEVGPTTLEAGFQWGFGLTSGEGGEGVRTVPSVAGGICQVATTLFQPVFWSGYQLEERHWHLYWIPAYTSRGVVGLDATVDADSKLDFQFINPTPDYLLIQAWTEGDTVNFALYGRKPNWKVEVAEPQITNQRPADPTPVAQEDPSMPWGRRLQVESARDGFDVLIVRRVISPDGSERTLRLKSSYLPSRTVTLVGTKGKPPEIDLEAVLAEARGEKPPENQPVQGGDSGGEAPKPTPAPGAQPTPAPGAQPTPAPTAAPRPATPTPGP